MIDTPRLSTRKAVLEFFIRNPDSRFTMAQIVTNGFVAQQLKHHLIKLSAEGQIDEVREGQNKFYSLSPTLRKKLKAMQAEDKRKTEALEAQLQQAAAASAEKETVNTSAVAVAEQPQVYKSRQRHGPNGQTRNRIFELMESCPQNEVSINEIAQLFDISSTVASKHLRNLVSENKIKITRKHKGIHLYQPIPTARIKTATRNLKQVIFEYFQLNWEEYHTAKQIAEAVEISEEEANSQIKILCEEHKIKIGSNGRINDPNGTKYKISIAPVQAVPAKPILIPEPVVAKAITSVPVTTLAPPQPVKKSPYIMFLRSIMQRLKNSESINEYDIHALDEHINQTPHVMFLRSIVQRLKDGQALNEYDIQALDEHISSL